ncbi:MAG TPA: ferritin-like domain-containing protein [Labilithrix sp.]|nr:ferritin-like domain-containing protein [Labilithrix sp.]
MQLPVYRIVEGRRPAGLVMPEPVPSATVLGDYFAYGAYLQAASAVAFGRLERELGLHGAPDELVDGSRLARFAELRHARSLGRLARLHGAHPVTPKAQTARVRDLVDIALANIVEGFVRTTYGAAVAEHRARVAEDDEIRSVMVEIAPDERVHAQLALDTAVWLQSEIDPVEGALVEDAMRHAVISLARELDVEVDSELRTRAGVPSRAEALAIWSDLSKRVWHGLSECVWTTAA